MEFQRSGHYAVGVADLGAFVVVSYIVLIFADPAPKSIALIAPERAAMLIASPLRLLILVARPFLAALEGSNALVLWLRGVKRRVRAGCRRQRRGCATFAGNDGPLAVARPPSSTSQASLMSRSAIAGCPA